MLLTMFKAGHGSSVGRGFDPHIQHHSFMETGHENISTAILPLPQIQEGQWSVTGERMCIKYLYTAQEACPGTAWIG